MNILYIGDIMAMSGISVVERVLPQIISEYQVDFVIAQAENVSEGRGITIADYERLHELGIDGFTGGNWTLYRPEILPLLDDPQAPLVRPANYPVGTPGKEWKLITKEDKTVLIISLLGHVVGRDADKPLDNPLQKIDALLEQTQDLKRDATIVNFHGDYSSEKRVIGYYLDGKVTAVIGDHWHVPTADAMVLPNGTAHITDVGMCGALHSSLGVKLDTIITRWRDNQVNKNELETAGPKQFNAVLIEFDKATVGAKSIKAINRLV